MIARAASKPVPKPRRDGRCYVCRKPIVIAQPRTGVNPAYYVDPFCSTGCARTYYGVDTTGAPT